MLWILGCAIARLGQGRGAIGKWGWGSLVWDWAGCGWGCLGGRRDDLIRSPKNCIKCAQICAQIVCPNIWAHPTCHPKAHHLSKKCMNNLDARFGRDPILGRDPSKFGRTIWAGPPKIWARDLGGGVGGAPYHDGMCRIMHGIQANIHQL